MLAPVRVSGSTVQLATLHNEDQVRIKDVRPGDTVIVRKAGDVIPEVVGPVPSKRPAKTREWRFPDRCPICAAPLLRLEGESDTFCTNVDCPGQRDQRIVHFASRGAMDIEGLGERTVMLLTAKDLVTDIGDIYALTYDDLIGLEGFADLSVRNLLASIEGSKERPLANLLVGLGIRHVGGRGAEVLASGFGHLDAIIDASEEALAAAEGVGPVIASSVHEFFALERNRAVVDKLRAASVNFEGPAGPDLPQTLSGKAVVVTGTLEEFSRDGALDAIKARGGTSPGSVSKKTAYVVVGRDPGVAKLNKAADLGIPTVDEAGFLRLLKSGDL
jgi:DNA ligase (NAD+)